MNESLALLWASVAGLGLGAIFFGGLWWTVRLGASSQHPALWFIGSLLLRMGVVLAGVYWVAGPRWDRLLLCLVGFTVARLIATKRMRPLRAGRPGDAAAAKEAGHAP